MECCASWTVSWQRSFQPVGSRGCFSGGVACAFTGLLSLFTEGLLSAKIYLAEALRDAVSQLLLDDDRYFDFEPTKLYGRLSETEREAWFTDDMRVRDGCDDAWRELDMAAAKVLCPVPTVNPE